jgi:hypothetical protein
MHHTTNQQTSLKIFDDFQQCHDFLGQMVYQGPALGFGDNECRILRDNKIRIAIIDNGVDKVREDLFENIENGISYVTTLSGGRILPWWMVADPHGTQMASLIRGINPFCRLFVARVGRRRDDIDPLSAAKVSWSIGSAYSLENGNPLLIFSTEGDPLGD